MNHPLKNIVRQLVFYTLAQGLLFILLGILIFSYPQLLIALASAVFILAGLTFLLFSWKIARLSSQARKFWDKVAVWEE